MAERLISPGVFTRENDQSFLQQGVSAIGAVVIGPTPKGPAFIPTTLSSYDDFMKIYGDADGKSYVPYTVKNYLKNAGTVTVVRTCGMSGYDSNVLTLGYTANSSSVTQSQSPFAVLAPVNSADPGTSWSVTASVSSKKDFVVKSGSVGYSASLNPSSQYYIANVFSKNPATTTLPFYLYMNYSDSEIVLNALTETTSSMLFSDKTGKIQTSASQYAYSSPTSPYVVNATNKNLFRFTSFNAGATDIFTVISNIRFPGEVAGTDWGDFDVEVHSLLNNESLSPTPLEVFTKVNLDPTSPNYIARKIGDQYLSFALVDGEVAVDTIGDYTNKSKYIRVELNDDDDFIYTDIPYGHASYVAPLGVISAISAFPTASMLVSQKVSGNVNYKYTFGLNLANNNNLEWLTKPFLSTATGLIPSSSFLLTGTTTKMIDSSDSEVQWTTTAPSKSRKFTLALQGGFDGLNPTVAKNMGTNITATNVMGFDCSSATATGTKAFRYAIDLVSNPLVYDLNMLIVPGLLNEIHGSVTTYALSMCEERADVFYLMDNEQLTSSIGDAISAIDGIDSSYATTYSPWIKIYDATNSKYLWAPPSVVMAGVISFSDRYAAEWWAPAGLNRGGITDGVKAYRALTKGQLDQLYENRINPIITISGTGLAAWGQKTLQVKSSALDRINVRRLLIAMKKYIASTTRYLVFEQNTVQTRTRFLNMVNPYMESIQQRQGLYAFKVIMDETNNTADTIDRLELRGAVYIQPSKSAEYVIIDFNILPTGASFSQ